MKFRGDQPNLFRAIHVPVWRKDFIIGVSRIFRRPFTIFLSVLGEYGQDVYKRLNSVSIYYITDIYYSIIVTKRYHHHQQHKPSIKDKLGKVGSLKCSFTTNNYKNLRNAFN